MTLIVLLAWLTFVSCSHIVDATDASVVTEVAILPEDEQHWLNVSLRVAVSDELCLYFADLITVMYFSLSPSDYEDHFKSICHSLAPSSLNREFKRVLHIDAVSTVLNSFGPHLPRLFGKSLQLDDSLVDVLQFYTLAKEYEAQLSHEPSVISTVFALYKRYITRLMTLVQCFNSSGEPSTDHVNRAFRRQFDNLVDLSKLLLTDDEIDKNNMFVRYNLEALADVPIHLRGPRGRRSPLLRSFRLLIPFLKDILPERLSSVYECTVVCMHAQTIRDLTVANARFIRCLIELIKYS